MVETQETVDEETPAGEDVVDTDMEEQQDQEEKTSEQMVEDEEDELSRLTRERDESNDKLLRLAADFENYKKRMERARLDSMRYREEALLKELLPVVDNLNRAIEQGQKSGEGNELLEGVELTCKGLFTVLEKFEVTPLDSLGEPFDPNIHEALAMDHSDDIAENHVLVEFEKGYQYKDKLIRPAKVVVSKGAAA